MGARFLGVLVIFAGLSNASLAQGISDRAIGAGAEQRPQPSGPETVSEPTAESRHEDFEFNVTLPVFGTNNAVPALGAGNSVPSREADVELNPDILLHWSHQFERVRLTASAGISSDRFYIIPPKMRTMSMVALKRTLLTDGLIASSRISVIRQS
jgi:hypothetical protein